ncbi:MAG: ATP-binding protein [Spirochaetia bacterium]
MLPRAQTGFLKQVLREFPIVALIGARQTGKTTLVQAREIGANRSYRSLDEYDTLDIAKRDPAAFLQGTGDITIDEVQRVPELFSAMKVEVDRDRRPGRFLCTGSANLLRMKQISESLAGRAVYLGIPPMTWAEIESVKLAGALDDALSATKPEDLLRVITRARKAKLSLADAVVRGGYPVPCLSDDPAFRARWYDGYIATYLERDLRLLAAVDDLIGFRRLMQAAALRNGSLLNIAQVAQDAGVPPTTARRYLSLLEISFQIWQLPAFTVNRGKRLAKTPKLLWLDSGLAAHIAGFQDAQMLVSGRSWGLWLEAWVGHHLRTWASMKAPRPELSYWRTSDGREVDYVVESGQRLLPIEVKAVSRPTGTDIRGLETFLDLYPEAHLGLLVCACKEPIAMSGRVVALPIEDFLLGWSEKRRARTRK